MRRIVLIPLSGYINRIQAIASAALLAEDLQAELEVCWIPDAVVPVTADRVLSAELCERHVVSVEQMLATTGLEPDQIPLYLNRSASTVTLAGHLRGEQAFMAEIDALMGSPEGQEIQTIVIRAGGKFYLPRRDTDEDRFRQRRHDFYSRRFLRDEIEETARTHAAENAPFLGLHLRYTDRAHQAPRVQSIARALRTAAEESGLTQVLVTGDSARTRCEWVTRLDGMGLEPWWIPQDAWDRSAAGSEFPALVDWRALSLAQRSVYFAESSFAVEAAVASDGYEHSFALGASPARAFAVQAGQWGRAALTYPRRHGWWGR